MGKNTSFHLKVYYLFDVWVYFVPVIFYYIGISYPNFVLSHLLILTRNPGFIVEV